MDAASHGEGSDTPLENQQGKPGIRINGAASETEHTESGYQRGDGGAEPSAGDEDQQRVGVVQKTFRAGWNFVIEPKHSNALVAIFTVLIFVTGFFYTIFAALQWLAVIDSNRINHDSLVSVQRAFVTYEGMNLDAYPTSTKTKDMAWTFTANLVNGGTTPAIDKVQEFRALNTLPSEPTELEFIGPDNDHPVGEIGPKAQSQMGPLVETPAFVMGEFPFTISSIGSKAFQSFFRSRNIFVWGWVGYRDVFPGTRPHVTEFCEEVQAIAMGLNPAAKPPLPKFIPHILFRECSEHNCTDEHCKDYETIAAMVPR